MTVSKEQYQKVVDYNQKKGDRAYAEYKSAQADGNSKQAQQSYVASQRFYNTAKLASENSKKVK